MPSFKKDDLVPLYALLRGWPGGPNVRVKWRHSESGRLAPLAAVKPSVPTTWQGTWLGTWLGMQPAQVLLPLLGVLFLHHQQHVQGAALDLAALVRQYEDQVGSVGLDRFTGIWPCCESSLREFISGVRKASCSWRGWRGTWGSRGCRLVVHLLKREVSQYSLYRTTCRGSWLGLWPKTWSGTSCFWKIWTVLIWLYIYNVSRCRQLMWTRMTTLWFSTVALLSGTGSLSTQRIDSLHEKRNLFRWRLVLTVLVLSATFPLGWHNPDVRCKQRKSDLQLWKGHVLYASWPRKYLDVIIWSNLSRITLFDHWSF